MVNSTADIGPLGPLDLSILVTLARYFCPESIGSKGFKLEKSRIISLVFAGNTISSYFNLSIWVIPTRGCPGTSLYLRKKGIRSRLHRFQLKDPS
jgi:hypothetical protein